MKRSWDEIGMAMAILIAEGRSQDPKHKVGCVIISEQSKTPIAFGYNGRAPGEINDRESNEVGRSGYLHAEENALLAASSRFVVGENHILYCTHEPCDHCARLIIRSNAIHRISKISAVVYLEPYYDPWRRERDLPRGADILSRAGIIVTEYKQATITLR